MNQSVFIIPYQKNFILYAPLKEIISLINPAAATDLRRRWENKNTSHAETCTNTADRFPFNNAPLINLTFILTSDCTMNCIYCYARGGENKEVLSWETITGVCEDVIERFVQSDPDHQLHVSFHGGDISSVWPLFQRSVIHIREICRISKIPLSVSAGINGALSLPQQKWFINNIDDATVSMDGFSEIQNYQRPLANQKDSFSIVDQTLKFFDGHNFSYGLRCTVTGHTVSRLEEIVDFFCTNYRTKKIMTEPMFPMGRGNQLAPPSTNDFIYHFRKANKIAKRHNVELIYSGARLRTTTSIFCQALDNSMVVTPDGSLSCCYEVFSSNDPASSYFFYGYFDKQRRKLVFNEEKRQRLFSLIDEERKKCQTCFCKYHCAGDCPVKSIFHKISKDEVQFDRCHINRELTKDQLIDALGIDH